eukprot:6182497-Pleurochrysis_carterae.AAC.2
MRGLALILLVCPQLQLIEDVNTGDIKYLLLPFYRGDFLSRLNEYAAAPAPRCHQCPRAWTDHNFWTPTNQLSTYASDCCWTWAVRHVRHEACLCLLHKADLIRPSSCDAFPQALRVEPPVARCALSILRAPRLSDTSLRSGCGCCAQRRRASRDSSATCKGWRRSPRRRAEAHARPAQTRLSLLCLRSPPLRFHTMNALIPRPLRQSECRGPRA